jgi:hypothetical protein
MHGITHHRGHLYNCIICDTGYTLVVELPVMRERKKAVIQARTWDLW